MSNLNIMLLPKKLYTPESHTKLALVHQLCQAWHLCNSQMHLLVAQISLLNRNLETQQASHGVLRKGLCWCFQHSYGHCCYNAWNPLSHGILHVGNNDTHAQI